MNLTCNETKAIIKDLEDFSHILKLAGNHKRCNEIDEHIKVLKIALADKVLQSDAEVDFDCEEDEDEEVECPDDMLISERRGREIPADFYDDFEDCEIPGFVITAKLPNGKWDYFRVGYDYGEELEIGDYVIVPFLDGLYVSEVLSMKSDSEMRKATVDCMSAAKPYWRSEMKHMINVKPDDGEWTDMDMLVDTVLFNEDDRVAYVDENGCHQTGKVNFIHKAPLEANTFYPYARMTRE